MHQSINAYAFERAFVNADRADQFSYAARKALFEYIEEINPDYELNVIELCCEYVESTYDDVRSAYDDCTDMADEDVIEYLGINTSIVWFGNATVLYAQF